MIPLIPALSGAFVVAGLLLAVWALIPRPESVGRPSTSWREGRLGGWWQRTDPRMRWALGAALSMGVVIATVTGFVLAIVVLPLAVVGVPYLAASSPQSRRIARLEGIAEWTRNLSGVLSVGVGLEQALIATLRSTPEAIRPAYSVSARVGAAAPSMKPRSIASSAAGFAFLGMSISFTWISWFRLPQAR